MINNNIFNQSKCNDSISTPRVCLKFEMVAQMGGSCAALTMVCDCRALLLLLL